jgi:hypothetical protein
MHGLEHTVEADFNLLDLGDKPLSLKKVYKEKWTKRRGQAEQEMTGHTTDYYIDGVPTTAGEYQTRIQELAPESLFRLLTNPQHFSEIMKWQERRRMLLDVCGDISDTDVIASDPSLAPLAAILGKRTLDDHKKVVLAERKRINEQIEKIPTRIDEVVRGMPEDAEKLDAKKLDSGIARAQKELEEAKAELSRLVYGGQSAELTKHLRDIEAEIQAKKNKHLAEVDKAARKHSLAIQETVDRLAAIENSIKTQEQSRSEKAQQLRDKRAEIEKLRVEWNAIDARKFEAPELESACPACGQTLPQDQVDAARTRALEAFNESKARELERVSLNGKAAAVKVKALELESDNLERRYAAALVEQEKIRAELEAAKAAQLPGIPAPEGLEDLEQEVGNLQRQIDVLKDGNSDQIAQAKSRIEAMSTIIKTLEQDRHKIDRLQRDHKRIEELKAEEKQLSKEYERLEHELYLCEQFLRAKVSMLESSINSKFSIVRFKLFHQQVNGGLEETCEMTVNGVPYASLNSAARLQGGMDIINVLAAHHGFHPPVFIDNRESVTEIPETKAQIINLYVDPAYPKLEAKKATAAAKNAA